jgi:hypothetical protein
MTDFVYPSESPERCSRWVRPVIVIGVIGVITIGLWAGHHQPEPVSCEPESHPVVYQTASPTTPDPVICWPHKIIWTTPGYDFGNIAPR